MATWIWALNGDAPRAAWALSVAESATYEGPMPDGSASFESARCRARASLAPYGLEAMRVDAERAVGLEPPGSPWHTMAALLHGCACMLLGRRDEAVRALERAGRLGRDTARPGVSFALGQRALLAADEADWDTATACAQEARAVVDSAGLRSSLTSLPVYVAAATVARHHGDEHTAGVDTAVAMRLYRRPSPAAFPWLAAQMGIRLGQLLLDSGNEGAARLKATEAGRFLPLLGPATVLLGRHDDLLTRLGQMPDAPPASSLLTAAERRVLPLLATHLSLGEIAGQLVLSRNTVKTQVAGIYRKLDASNRAEAVRNATERGMLGEEGAGARTAGGRVRRTMTSVAARSGLRP
jgi:LuxR family maltose regulon positive regulatory protein